MILIIEGLLLLSFYGISLSGIIPSISSDFNSFNLELLGIVTSLLFFIHGIFQIQEKKSELLKKEEMNKNLETLQSEVERKSEEYLSLATLARESKESEFSLKNALKSSDVKFEELKSNIDTLPGRELVNFISLLQSKGRFVDFLMEDITKYNDGQVGSVARFVHQGCSSIIKDLFDIAPIYVGHEGENVKLDEHNPALFKLSGKVADSPPYNGKVVHKGWISKNLKVPKFADINKEFKKELIITPAEIEII